MSLMLETSGTGFQQGAEKVRPSRLRKKSPPPAPSLLSPPGQGEKIEEGSHLLCRVLPPSEIIPALGTLFPHPARALNRLSSLYINSFPLPFREGARSGGIDPGNRRFQL